MIPIWLVPIDESCCPHSGLVRLQRVERGDQPIHHNWHIFRYPTANRNGWYWGGRPRWISRYAPGSGSPYYSYIFTFGDYTTGICRVEDVNDALAEIGYRVDLDPPI